MVSEYTSDALEVLDIVDSVATPKYIRRPLKDRLNPLLQYDDIEFYRRFRLRKDGFQHIFTLVEHQIVESNARGRFPSIPPVIQLAG